jgi:hypothetical protein
LLDNVKQIMRYRQRVNGPRVILYVLGILLCISILTSIASSIGGQ